MKQIHGTTKIRRAGEGDDVLSEARLGSVLFDRKAKSKEWRGKVKTYSQGFNPFVNTQVTYVLRNTENRPVALLHSNARSRSERNSV